MISLVTACFMGLMTNVAEPQFQVQLASAARSEIQIIERLRSLRKATEKLPENWKATGVKGMPQGSSITKADLLKEVEQMEFTAAERWSVIVENAARADVSKEKLSKSDIKARRDLEALTKSHFEINQKLDQFNSNLKNGIIMNLASKFLSNTN